MRDFIRKNTKQASSYKRYLVIMCTLLLLIATIAVYLRFKSPREDVIHDPIAPYYKQESKLPKNLISREVINSPLKKIQLPIIMYHYVEYVKDPKDTIRKSLDINPFIFDFQLKTLANNGYESYFVRDIPGILNGSKEMAKKSIVLTFDDGYEDFYTDAFPILKKYNFKATIYIIVDFIGRHGFLNEKEIKEIAQSGLVEIGSHTLNHYYLKKAPKAVAQEEIFLSKSKLESLFGIKVDTFAYPFGALDEQSIELVKEASYSAAVSVAPGNVLTPVNLFYLPRIRAGNITGPNMIGYLERTR